MRRGVLRIPALCSGKEGIPYLRGFSTLENSNLPQTVDLLDRYRALVTLGKIQWDEEQVRVVMQMRRLQKELVDYTPASISSLIHAPPSKDDQSPSWWTFSQTESDIDGKGLIHYRGITDHLMNLDSPKGLLLTGPPGSGKSFLVDLWFSSLPTPYKTRKHYSQLVLEIYRGVWEETQRRMAFSSAQASRRHTEIAPKSSWTKLVRDEWRELSKTGSLPTFWSRVKQSSIVPQAYSYPPMAYTIARRLLLRHWLLVFDEIQLLDVSSACLLSDVLSWYWRMGGVVVGTSNKVPEDLYKNGVQRDRLEPFVEALKTRCPVVSMPSERDWRVVRSGDGEGRTWFLRDQESQFEKILNALAKANDPRSQNLSIFGHRLGVTWVSGNTAKFSFNELCDASLGPADYLTLSSTFKTIIITDIPILKLSARNQARRFISLIDALYESRCQLVCLAETEPENLFFPDAPLQDAVQDDLMMAESVAESGDVYRPNVSSYDTPNMTEAPVSKAVALNTLSIFSGKDEQFAFKRALSRLIEMTSASYAQNEVWMPLDVGDRKWEAAHASSFEISGSSHSSMLREEGADFAEEASHEGDTAKPELKRPPPPKLKSHHVWGVRDDWGDAAKQWGKGAKAYEKEGHNTD